MYPLDLSPVGNGVIQHIICNLLNRHGYRCLLVFLWTGATHRAKAAQRFFPPYLAGLYIVTFSLDSYIYIKLFYILSLGDDTGLLADREYRTGEQKISVGLIRDL